jgi:hypothetical protein
MRPILARYPLLIGLLVVAAVKMPEIERNGVHTEGADRLRACVSSLPGDCN